MQPTKAELRRHAIAWRSNNVDHRDEISGLVVRGLVEFLVGQQVGREPLDRDPANFEPRILLYAAMATEPDVKALTEVPGLGQFALTRTPDGSMDLTLHPWDSQREMHRYGFEQPTSTSPFVADHLINIVLVPGLLFDRSGGRLGFGAGYYDRLLARIKAARGLNRLQIVGVSDHSPIDRVPTESHDVSMTHLATTSGVVAVTPPVLDRSG